MTQVTQRLFWTFRLRKDLDFMTRGEPHPEVKVLIIGSGMGDAACDSLFLFFFPSLIDHHPM